MKTCDALAEVLSGLVDGRVSASERAEAELHLAGCPGCREKLRWEKAVKAAAAAVPAPAMPAGLKASLLARARQAERRKQARAARKARWESWLRPSWPAVGVGLAFAAAAVVIVIRAGSPRVEVVNVDDMLAEHRAYAMTMPLAQDEAAAGFADALAGSRR